MTPEERFWSKVDKSGDCWLWTAGVDDHGYGQFKFYGKNIKAHRVAYFLTHAVWPVETRHSCDIRLCVRPEHLLDGTHQDNVNDMIERQRGNWQLTDEQVKEIRALEYNDTIVKTVTRRYGLEYSTAVNVLTGITYKHLADGRLIPRQKYKRKLTDADVDKIKLALTIPHWGQQGELAKEYGVSRYVIYAIAKSIY